jgi:hypothetical protein
MKGVRSGEEAKVQWYKEIKAESWKLKARS